MERGKFYLPCGNNVDALPPSFEGWHDPKVRWNGHATPAFNKEVWDKICAYYKDPETNTQESIDDLKEYMDEKTAKLTKGVSVEGSLYDFGSFELAWGCEADD